MNTPSDSAIAQAAREAIIGLWIDGIGESVTQRILRRARQIDAAQPAACDTPARVDTLRRIRAVETLLAMGWKCRNNHWVQPAAAGELPEAVAWQVRGGGEEWQSIEERNTVGLRAEFEVRALYTADQLRAAVAGYRRDADVLSAMLHEGVPRSVADSVVRLLQEGLK